MNKKFLLYGYGGAFNHGGEAIAKCTIDLIRSNFKDSKITLSTHFKEQDIKYNIPADEFCERDLTYLNIDKSIQQREMTDKLVYKSTLDKINKDTVCLSVGGDNYCYDNWRKWKTIHDHALNVGAKSILWSCSIDPSMMNDDMIETLSTHHFITARECITYNALMEKGIKNVVQCSDVAFLLKSKNTNLPQNFIEGNTVAINISPLVVRRELKSGIILENIYRLVSHIINNTDMNIALIPHVVMPMDNDYELLKDIYNHIDSKERVCLISDTLDASEYKYIISKCRFGIYARTHASVASYSSCIPTIAIGYSTKAVGIANDLELQEYVIPLSLFFNEFSLLTMFMNLTENEKKIINNLEEKIPPYIENARNNAVLSILK